MTTPVDEVLPVGGGGEEPPEPEDVPKLDREVGSAVDVTDPTYSAYGDVMFGSWDDGLSMEGCNDPTTEQLQKMLKKSGKARSLESVLTLPLRGTTWTIRADEEDDPEIVEFVTRELRRTESDGGMSTPMDMVISQMVAAIIFRRSYHEKVWQRRDLHVVYKKIAYRPPAACTLLRDKKTGDPKGFKQRVPGRGHLMEREVTIKPQYAVVHVHGKHREPFKGITELEVAYWCWEMKQKLRFLWGLYLENCALPRIVVKGRNESGAQKAAKAIASVRSSGVVGIPGSWLDGDIKALDVSGKGSAEYQAALESLDHEAALSVLALFTELGDKSSQVGSLSRSQIDFFLKLEEGFADELNDTITNDIIADLVRYNFGRQAPVPQFELGPLNRENADISLELLKSFGTASTLNVPQEFVYSLVMEIGKQLGLDLNALKVAIDKRTQQLEQQAAALNQPQLAPVAAATQVGAEAAAGALGTPLEGESMPPEGEEPMPEGAPPL